MWNSRSESYYRQAASIASKFTRDERAAELLMSLSIRAVWHGNLDESDRWMTRAEKFYKNAEQYDR